MQPITIEAKLEPNGQGKLILNGVDISGMSSGISIVNSVHGGNVVTITVPSPLLDIKVESNETFFRVGDRLFRLLDIT